MKRAMAFTSLLLLALTLVGCSDGGNGSQAADSKALGDDYPDALAVPAQLALGSLQLDETELAVDEAQAATLLPLWQAYQSLSNSDKAAQAEVDALLKQIQGAMSAAQIEAIAELKLTQEAATTWMQENGGGLGRGGLLGGGDRGDGETGRLPGGGGGFPGGGFPGGGGGGRLQGSGELGQAGVDARATRIAEMGSDPAGMAGLMANQLTVNFWIRSLQVKTGEMEESALGGFAVAWRVASDAIGVPVETIREEVAGGATLAEVIAAHDGDLEAVESALQVGACRDSEPGGARPGPVGA